MTRFDPNAITTSRILSNDVTPDRIRANSQSANLRKSLAVKLSSSPSGQSGIRQTSGRRQR